MKKIFCFFAFILMFATVCFAAEENPTLRVGLYYAEDAMPSANLQVTNGKGYRLGFHDSKLTFIQLYYTDAAKITMTNDMNIWYSNNKFYTSGAPSGAKLLGAYHIECISQYSTLEAAKSSLAGFSAKGYQGFVAYVNGSYRVRLGSYSTIEEAKALQAQIGGNVVGNSKTAVSVYNTDNGNIIFEYDTPSIE